MYNVLFQESVEKYKDAVIEYENSKKAKETNGTQLNLTSDLQADSNSSSEHILVNGQDNLAFNSESVLPTTNYNSEADAVSQFE